MELYKYCKTEHLEKLLSSGGLRLGTLFDWRKNEKHGELVYDECEGYIQLKGDIVFYDYRFIEDQRHIGTVNVQSVGENQVRHFKNEVLHTCDMYSFSCSMNYSEMDHRRWYELEGYDACYVIHSPRLFFRAISKELMDANFRLQAPVIYFDNSASKNVFEGFFHPALLKNINFQDQNEFRGLWKPFDTESDISPRIIERSDAHKYCSEYRMIPTLHWSDK